jgi:hypothetical protein
LQLFHSTTTTTVSTSQRLEAEQALLFGAKVLALYPGYTGTGYADYQNSTGDYIEWTANVADAGTYNLTFKHAAPTVRSLEIRVNGSVVNSSLTFPATADLSTWTTLTISANLLGGTNKIRATAIGTSGPNIDHLVVQKSTSPAIFREEEENVQQVNLLPNPVFEGEILMVKIPSNEGDKIGLSMFDILGKKIADIDKIAENNGVTKISLNTTGATEGMYIINVKVGKSFYSRRVFIRQQ